MFKRNVATFRAYNAYFAITYFTNFALMTNPNPKLSDRGIPEIREMGSMTHI